MALVARVELVPLPFVMNSEFFAVCGSRAFPVPRGRRYSTCNVTRTWPEAGVVPAADVAVIVMV
jgi:hypothetical protein